MRAAIPGERASSERVDQLAASCDRRERLRLTYAMLVSE